MRIGHVIIVSSGSRGLWEIFINPLFHPTDRGVSCRKALALPAGPLCPFLPAIYNVLRSLISFSSGTAPRL